VRPVVHYMMGGISTDINGKTPLEGLYAAGECACVSINGANRLGSNSLTELLVFGARAGQSAARYAMERPAVKSNPVSQLVSDERRRLDTQFLRADGRERIADIREAVQKSMESGAGIYREREGRDASCGKLRTVRGQFAYLGVS